MTKKPKSLDTKQQTTEAKPMPKRYIIIPNEAADQINDEVDAAFFKAFPEGRSPGACHTQRNLIATQTRILNPPKD